MVALIGFAWKSLYANENKAVHGPRGAVVVEQLQLSHSRKGLATIEVPLLDDMTSPA